MNHVIGIAWYKDEAAYRRALAVYYDPSAMPATYEEWQAVVAREREEIRGAGNIALRVDIDPDTFRAWCKENDVPPDSAGRTKFVRRAEFAYENTGQGTVLE